MSHDPKSAAVRARPSTGHADASTPASGHCEGRRRRRPGELAGQALRAGAGIVALGAIAKFASSPGQSFWLAAFVDPMIKDTGITRTGFSGLYALATVGSAAMAIAVGRAVDRVGVRPVWLAVAIGLAIGCLTLSIAAGALAVLVALCLLRAFGQGSFPLLGTVLVASSFDRARGRAMSLASLGITVAGVVLPGVAVALIALAGWRGALQLTALFLLIVILPLGLLVKAKARRRPALPMDVPAPQLPRAPRRARPGVISLLFILAVPPLITTAVVVHATSVLGAVGISLAGAAVALSAMAAFGAAGALLAGAMVDRFAPHAVLVVLGAALAVGVAFLFAGGPATGFAAFFSLGFAVGVYHTTNGSLWAKAYGIEGLGRMQGLASGTQIAGAAAGPFPLALSLSLAGSYRPGLVFLGILALIGLVVGARWRLPELRIPAPRLAAGGVAA